MSEQSPPPYRPHDPAQPYRQEPAQPYRQEPAQPYRQEPAQPYRQADPSWGGRAPAPYGDAETRRDVAAALAARAELGAEYNEHVAAGLADRIEQLAAMRTAELRRAAEVTQGADAAERTSQRQRFVLGIVSLGAGIPITAISGSVVEPGLLGLAVAWAGIVGVNVAAGLGRRRR
jgi:hypothetical protein